MNSKNDFVNPSLTFHHLYVGDITHSFLRLAIYMSNILCFTPNMGIIFVYAISVFALTDTQMLPSDLRGMASGIYATRSEPGAVAFSAGFEFRLAQLIFESITKINSAGFGMRCIYTAGHPAKFAG